jgi:ribosome-binding factor A|tara:strand:+ start:325 stop:651 length:327 start_codon:yes stop_codon:yes gene_type:complete
LFSSKPYKRAQRVSDNIRREIANIFSFEISDPRLRGLTITEVQLSDDLSSAKIFLSNYINQALNEEQEGIAKALENSKPFVKKKLGQNIKLKKMPELLFFIDQQDSPI